MVRKNLFSSALMFVATLAISLGLVLSAFLSGEITLAKNPSLAITARYGNSSSPTSHLGSSPSTRHTSAPAETFFVLAIGNDFRPGVGGKRADAIHLIAINPKENRASIINFPRDTTVSIPGHGRGKINAANAYGGSSLTAQTLEQLVGVSISYILEVDFAGFTGLVNDLGGVDVQVEKSMKDKNSGSNFEPGMVHMDGAQALSFARDRYSFSDGDISRTYNQGILLISALKELISKRITVSSKFESAAFIAKNVSLTNLTLRDLYILMEVSKGIDASQIPNITVPWSGSNTLAPSANNLFNDFKDNAIIDTYGR